MTTMADVLGLEERAMNAWPGLQTVTVDGWAIRMAGGCTKRANSVNALAPRGDFAAVIRTATTVYAAHRLPTIFRMSPLAPAACDAALAERGFTLADPSLVMLAPLQKGSVSPDVDIGDTVSAAWLHGIAEANGINDAVRPAHDAIVRSIAMPAAFAIVRRHGLPVGFGLAVRERGTVGLFDIVVAPAARGQGLGRAIAQALMAWGQAGGATHAYLQVRAVNTVALTLYAGLGFTEAYRYHFRLPPSYPD